MANCSKCNSTTTSTGCGCGTTGCLNSTTTNCVTLDEAITGCNKLSLAKGTDVQTALETIIEKLCAYIQANVTKDSDINIINIGSGGGSNQAVAANANFTTNIVFKTAIAGNDNLVLPNPAILVTPTIIEIKDKSGTAAVTNFTVTPAAGNIDGSASVTVSSNYGSLRLIHDGTNYYTLS